MWTTAARIATPKKGVSGDMAVAAKLCLTTELRKVSTLGISTENRFGWRGVARACAAQVAVYGQRGGGRVTLRSPHDSSYTLRCPWRKGTEENYRWFVFLHAWRHGEAGQIVRGTSLVALRPLTTRRSPRRRNWRLEGSAYTTTVGWLREIHLGTSFPSFVCFRFLE